MEDKLVIIRGAGDLATGVAQSLYEAGFRLLLLEVEKPSAIRRQVALCEAVYDGTAVVENLTCCRCQSLSEVRQAWDSDEIPLLVDPEGASIAVLKPWAVVDAILAKKNLGTNRNMAGHTVALGPGFTAGVDVDAVIETKRGHQLGRIIWQGTAIANTGIPGLIAGYGRERVIHSQQAGFVYGLVHIGDKVKKGQPMAVLTEEPIPSGMAVTERMGTPVLASLTGFVRGLIRNGYRVPQGFKIADIDPRDDERENCFTISDKARSLGGAVLTALLWMGKGEFS
ncbi:selenium-dependent molybdenum cofactor biosynthesis protein YqeB [Megasphaera sp. WILCCON 0056]|uniref:selenium-dependent molybdenum cofactor biosynthesis protein YqeB n=1 Tax=Megasphaera sp. WILCCON 0056 TaxID=3345340 RepID=UPI003A813CF3